jgi:hypothetical protein
MRNTLYNFDGLIGDVVYLLRNNLRAAVEKDRELAWKLNNMSGSEDFVAPPKAALVSDVVQAMSAGEKAIFIETIQTLAPGENAAFIEAIQAASLSNKAVRTMTAIERAAFVKIMMEQFGFDMRTAGLIAKVYEGILKKYPSATQRELNYFFARVLSQLSYNQGSIISANQWRAGAGFVYGYTDKEERAYFMKTLNFSEKDYNYLRGMVRLQHELAYGATSIAVDENWSTLESNYIANYKRCNGLPNSASVTKEEYLKWYGNQWSQYYGKGDFAHMMYTISATLVDPDAAGIKKKYPAFTDKFWIDSETRIDITGWLGDATISFPLSDPIHFGIDDYISDLDAVNIMALASKNPDVSLVKLLNNYFDTGGDADGGRTEAFLKNVGGYEYVQGEIFSRAGVDSLDELKNAFWQESYNFLRNLQEGNDTMKKLY